MITGLGRFLCIGVTLAEVRRAILATELRLVFTTVRRGFGYYSLHDFSLSCFFVII